MPFLPPNQQRQSTEGTITFLESKILIGGVPTPHHSIFVFV